MNSVLVQQEKDDIVLYNGDCLVVLEKLVEDKKSVDCIITDIPYNINFADWDNGFDLRKVLPLLHKLLKDTGNIILFNGWSTVCDVKSEMDKYFTIRNWIIYDRIKGRGAKTNVVSTREDILWYTKCEEKNKTYTFNKIPSNIPKKTGGMGKKNGEENRALSNVWSDISPIVPWSAERVKHPTQKPIQLMERCVKLWSNEGDIVLDFTMGSGSTGVACKNLNRKFIGIEINKEYFDIAVDRIFD